MNSKNRINAIFFTIITIVYSLAIPIQVNAQNFKETTFDSLEEDDIFSFDYVGIDVNLASNLLEADKLQDYLVINYNDVLNSKEVIAKYEGKIQETTQLVLIPKNDFETIPKEILVSNKGWGILFRSVGSVAAGRLLDVTFTGISHGVGQVYRNVRRGRSWHSNVLEETGYGFRRGWCNLWGCDD